MSESRIICHMIVGPTNEQYLEFSINNVDHEVDLFIINDNGKNPINKDRIDRSTAARTGKVIYFQSDFENFSQARNLCFDYTPDQHWDWLLKLDADEVHYPERFTRVCNYLDGIRGRTVETIRVHFHHLLSWRIRQSYETVAQIFRWNSGLRWNGVVHESLYRNPSVVISPEAFVHYSYTLTQPEIYDKWQRYSELEGDPEHYRSKGSKPETIIEDRYNTAGELFMDTHPPGVENYIQGEMVRKGYHNVPSKVQICIRGTDNDAIKDCIRNIQETANPDFPAAIYAYTGPEQIFKSLNHWKDQVLRLNEDESCGSFLFMDSSSRFPEMGWQKALVSSMYCLYDCYDAYRPKGAESTVLIPRDCMQLHTDLLRIYDSEYCRVDEEFE
jgi:hypothetical protein